MKPKLIVGLANPGEKYQATRHNAGAWFVESLAKKYQLSMKLSAKFHGYIARIQNESIDCFVLIPTTFMNLSGQSVQAVAKFYNIAPGEMLVAHDEIDLPTASIRLKKGGGHGGHNGLRNIIDHLHDKQFFRLRIGVGHPGHKDLVNQYVLKTAPKGDQQQIMHAVDHWLKSSDDLLSGKYDILMNHLHQKPNSKEEEK